MAPPDLATNAAKPSPPSHLQALPRYSTLKKSLSASFESTGIGPEFETRSTSEEKDSNRLQSSWSCKVNGQGAPPTSRPSANASIAFVSLMHLPIPVIVLSATKTVILANDAMGRLLGLTDDHYDGEMDTEGGDEDTSRICIDNLIGQTLSQVGIDAMRDGRRLALDWEVCPCPSWLRSNWTLIRL